MERRLQGPDAEAIRRPLQILLQQLFQPTKVNAGFRLLLLKTNLGELPELYKTDTKIIPRSACTSTVSYHNLAHHPLSKWPNDLSEAILESLAPGQIICIWRGIDCNCRGECAGNQ